SPVLMCASVIDTRFLVHAPRRSLLRRPRDVRVAPWPPADHRHRSITCGNQAAPLVWLVLGSCGCRLVRGQTGKARGGTSRCVDLSLATTASREKPPTTEWSDAAKRLSTTSTPVGTNSYQSRVVALPTNVG